MHYDHVRACTMIIIHACTRIRVHVSCPIRFSSLAMEIGESGGRSHLGKQEGFGRAAGPPNGDASQEREGGFRIGGMRGGGNIPPGMRAIPRDD